MLGGFQMCLENRAEIESEALRQLGRDGVEALGRRRRRGEFGITNSRDTYFKVVL
jgi:hypothetical protein